MPVIVMTRLTFTVKDSMVNERIDKCIVNEYPEYTRSFIQGLIKADKVTVNNSLCKSNYKIKANDCIAIMMEALAEPDIKPQNISLSIIYEDNDLLIVNKPKGMVVHPGAGHYEGTLVNAVMYYCKNELSGINGVLRPGIVHRIDRNTTGSVIVCKNDFSHQAIARQLKEHSIVRKYHAVVHGIVKEDAGSINAPIGRHRIDRKRMAVNEANGKPAITHYQVLQRFQQYTYVECRLETGRTHQIRVHMAYIHHPLLGDDVYGRNKSPYNLQGQTLHAKTIGFVHPRNGKYMEFDCPLPDYFQSLLHKLP